jgi:hypothetical protein
MNRFSIMLGGCQAPPALQKSVHQLRDDSYLAINRLAPLQHYKKEEPLKAAKDA